MTTMKVKVKLKLKKNGEVIKTSGTVTVRYLIECYIVPESAENKILDILHNA